MNKSKMVVFSLVALLLLTVAGLIGVSYAYWSRLTAERNNTVIIGEGTEVILTAVVEPEEGKVLVPAGNALGANEVESVTMVYNVRLSQQAAQNLELSVDVSDVQIGESGALAHLVNIAVTHVEFINNQNVQVQVVVTLTEPANEAEYNAVINKAITFKLTFSASVPEQAIEG